MTSFTSTFSNRCYGVHTVLCNLSIICILGLNESTSVIFLYRNESAMSVTQFRSVFGVGYFESIGNLVILSAL